MIPSRLRNATLVVIAMAMLAACGQNQEIALDPDVATVQSGREAKGSKRTQSRKSTYVGPFSRSHSLQPQRECLTRDKRACGHGQHHEKNVSSVEMVAIHPLGELRQPDL